MPKFKPRVTKSPIDLLLIFPRSVSNILKAGSKGCHVCLSLPKTCALFKTILVQTLRLTFNL